MYYLRTRAAADAIKFTVDQQALARRKAARAATAANSDAEPLKVDPLFAAHRLRALLFLFLLLLLWDWLRLNGSQGWLKLCLMT